jgi:hypothetical protein
MPITTAAVLAEGIVQVNGLVGGFIAEGVVFDWALFQYS